MATVLIILLMLGSVPAMAGKDSAGKINWLNFDASQKMKNDKNLKFFLYFHADWCTYCHKLEKNTFADQEVADYINTNFLPVIVDTMKDGRAASRFGVRGLPDIRFLTPEGEAIAKIPGYVGTKQMLTLLKYIHTDSYKTMSIADFSKQQN